MPAESLQPPCCRVLAAQEVCFAPLTGLEVESIGVEGSIVVARMRLSVNLAAPPIEQSVAKLKH